jgi:DNA-binding response OmpR family regulator
LARLEKGEPDVILLDVMMPGMDGFGICQHLKTDKHWQHIPIILITALNSKEDVVRGLDAGADEFISKPVEGLELRARVRSMLRIKQQYDQLKATMHDLDGFEVCQRLRLDAGQIAVASTPGDGSIFAFYLPRAHSV